MWGWVDRLGTLLLDAGLAALLLWSVVALTMLGSRQPVRRLRLARAAVIGSLAIWPLVGLRMVPKLDLVAALHDAGVLPHPWFSSETGAFPPVAPFPPPPAVLPPPPVAPGPSAPGPIMAHWVVRGLALAYLAGVACGVGWLVLGWLVLGRLIRCREEPSPQAVAFYNTLPFRSSRSRPRLGVVERVRRPVLVGAFRPWVLIPPGLDHPDDRDRLRMSLLHELAHAETADPRHALFANLAGALWFFIPPFWWVAAQIRLDQEFLADRRAALAFGPAPEYASSLLEYASNQTPILSSSPGGSERGSAFDGTGSPLFQRVLMLLRCPFPVETRPPVWWSWGMPCVVAVVTLGLSSLSIRPSGARLIPPRPTGTYQVSRLITNASPPGLRGRAPLCELPIRLPERFDLTLEVWGNSSTLPLTRVTNLPLDLGLPTFPPEPDRWHSVHVRRDVDGVRLWVDGERVHLGPSIPPLTVRLSVEPPPHFSVTFRNFKLTW